MKKTIYLILITLLIGQCRYKNNNTLSLQSVKTRLQGTWILKEGISDGVDVTSFNVNEELSFADVTKSKVNVNNSTRGSYYTQFDFKNHKTTFFYNTQNPLQLKI